jgi:hypothetical protein
MLYGAGGDGFYSGVTIASNGGARGPNLLYSPLEKEEASYFLK